MVQLTIMIPTYNEEGSIRDCIKRIPKMPWSTELLVVDNSKDKTPDIVKNMMKSMKNLRLVHYLPAQGKGHALKEGLKAARGEVVVICDVDMDPKELKKVVKPIFDDEADFVNGSRLNRRMEKGAMSFTHKIGNFGFAVILSVLTRKYLRDSLCGFKAWRTKMLPVSQLKENSWPDFELLVKARRNGMRIVDVPIRYTARRFGQAKMHTWRHGVKLLGMAIKLGIGKD
jgi:glycosyltransferase involved in cell wall biosynthesis